MTLEHIGKLEIGMPNKEAGRVCARPQPSLATAIGDLKPSRAVQTRFPNIIRNVRLLPLA